MTSLAFAFAFAFLFFFFFCFTDQHEPLALFMEQCKQANEQYFQCEQ